MKVKRTIGEKDVFGSETQENDSRCLILRIKRRYNAPREEEVVERELTKEC